jgi:hypothetical protein
MDKLLKEAIADAKAVRETALANAKLALEEAFTPKLQSMLSKKIREEEEMEEEEEVEEMPETARYRKLANISEEDDEMEDDMDMSMDMEDEGGEEDFEEEDFSDEGGEEDFEEESSEEAPEEDLDLEAIIRELEGEDDEMAEEGMDYDSEEEEMAEEGMKRRKKKMMEMDHESEDEMAEEGMDYEEEDIDINELVRALREEDEDEEMAEEGMKRRKKKMMEMDHEEESEKDEELEEAYGVIKYLRSKINEVNLLNAKLLYVNKVFRNKNLTENQKVQVIETFDRAKTVRETKLIYATIAESIAKQAPVRNKGKRIVENFSSAPTKGTKRPILESNNQVARFQKLAGINKNY